MQVLLVNSLVLVIICQLIAFTQASREGFKKGFGNIIKDSVDTDVDIVYGKVPAWINGVFVRHACGAFGDIDSDNDSHKITNLIDCIYIGQSFKFKDGRVSFYNRFYDTVTTDIYKSYGMNMTESKVFWLTALANFNKEAKEKHKSDYEKATSTKPKNVNGVNIWNINNKAIGIGELIEGVELDVNTMEVIQSYPFKDNTFGYDGDYHFFDHSAHEYVDADGTLWSNTMVILPIWWLFTIRQWRLVYKIVDDERIPVAEIEYPRIYPWYCDGTNPYPDPKAKIPYMHSFAATEHYIILPETSYVFEPCAFLNFVKKKDTPFYKTIYKFNKDIPSVLRVLRKYDGKIMAVIETKPFFASHQLNAYEEDGRIVMDMIIYEDASPYTRCTFIENSIKATICDSHIERFIINMDNWSLESRENLIPDLKPIEMPHVRTNLLGYKYKYSYVCEGIYINTQQHIHKLNMVTKEITSYTFDNDLYPQEPWFLPTPRGTDEDDGMLLVPGFDGNISKGFLLILDAHTMKPVTYILAPDMILFGFHGRFFSLDTQQKQHVVHDEN